jgi:hypothetical protein
VRRWVFRGGEGREDRVSGGLIDRAPDASGWIGRTQVDGHCRVNWIEGKIWVREP